VATLQVVDGSNLNTSFMLQIVVHPVYHGINSSTKGILSQHTISPSKCREKDLIGNHRELFLAFKGCSRAKRMKMGKESRDKQVYCYNVCKATKAIINNIRVL
jgi:hypothetical protein